MMDLRLPIISIILLLTYGSLFVAMDKHAGDTQANISPALPAGMLKVLGHSYMNQLIAESLFIKTAVYYGGLNKQMDEDNLDIMGRHFLTMSQLHPRLLDIYYRGESILAHRGAAYARTANIFLKSGRAALPDQVVLPFFEGFNYFHYLKKPVRAAEVLRIASNIPDSPQWIAHLASMLMASGGNIRTGLIWLKGMLSTAREKDEKARYKKDILTFEKAMQVQLALERYVRKHGNHPETLAELILDELNALPVFENNFQLEYQAPKLFLRRLSHE
jgi:hypothetical protein